MSSVRPFLSGALRGRSLLLVVACLVGLVDARATPAGARVGDATRGAVARGGWPASGVTGLPPAISADGRYVAFASVATNLVTGDTNGVSDIFVHDRNTTTTTRVS